MQKIPLMLARSGMVLARNIFRNASSTGNPVCGADTILSDALIARLENMDINSIYVKGHPVWQAGDRSLDEQLRDLEHRFEKVRQNPLMSRFYDIYADYLRRSMGDDGGQQAE